MTPRNYPAVTQVPASMFEKVKMASKEDLKYTVGAEWVYHIYPFYIQEKEDQQKVLLDSLHSVAPPYSLKHLRTVLEQSESLRDKDLKILDSLHVLCRVKALTNFSEYEIILPGELNLKTGDCKVTLDGKAFNERSSTYSFWFQELLIPGSDDLICLRNTSVFKSVIQ